MELNWSCFTSGPTNTLALIFASENARLKS